jgi:hypothetical protein
MSLPLLQGASRLYTGLHSNNFNDFLVHHPLCSCTTKRMRHRHCRTSNHRSRSRSCGRLLERPYQVALAASLQKFEDHHSALELRNDTSVSNNSIVQSSYPITAAATILAVENNDDNHSDAFIRCSRTKRLRVIDSRNNHEAATVQSRLVSKSAVLLILDLVHCRRRDWFAPYFINGSFLSFLRKLSISALMAASHLLASFPVSFCFNVFCNPGSAISVLSSACPTILLECTH